MSKKCFVGLMLAVAFLFAANVRADMIAGFGPENAILSVTVSKDGKQIVADGLDTSLYPGFNSGTEFFIFDPTGYHVTGFSVAADQDWKVVDFQNAFSVGGQKLPTPNWSNPDNPAYFALDSSFLTDGIFNFTASSNDWWHPVTITFYGTAIDPATTPEPATLAVLGLGLAGLGIARRRK